MAISYDIDTLIDCEYYIEPFGSYAQNVSGTQSYTVLKILDGSKMEKSKDAITNNVAKQRIDAWEPKVIGRRRNKATINMFLNGTGVPLSATIVPAPNGVMTLLKTTMGGLIYQSGSAVASGASTGSVTVTANQGGNFLPGQIVGLVNPVTHRLEATILGNITTDKLDFLIPLSFTPSVSDVVYNSYTAYLAQNPSSSIQLYAAGTKDVDRFVLCGLQGGFGITTNYGQLPQISFNLEGAFWNTGAAGTGQLTNLSFPLDADPPAFFDSEIMFFSATLSGAANGSVLPRTGSTGMNTPMKEIKFTPGIKYQDVMGAQNDNIIAKRRSRAVPALKVDLSPYFQDLTYWQARDTRTGYGLFVQIGNEAGKTIVIASRYGQITAVDRGDNDQLTGLTIAYEAKDNTSIGVQKTAPLELYESPILIAFV